MRRTILCFCVAALAVSALGLAAASADEEGEKLLRALAGVYKAADSMSYDLKVKQPPRSTGAQPVEIDAKVYLKKPNLAKVELISKADGLSVTLVSDGSTVWECDPAAELCLKRQAPDDPTDLGGRRGGLRYVDFGGFFSKDPYAALTENSVGITASDSESVDGVECSIVFVDYGRYREKLWLGQDNHMLRKSAMIFGTPEAGETEAMSSLYGEIELGADIEQTAFSAPELPDGTKIIEVPKMKDRVIVAGQKAPEFTVQGLDGNDVSLSDYKGKILLVDFWASWCGPCKVTIPTFNELHEKFGSKGLTVIGLDVWDQEEAMRKAIADLEIDYTVLYAPRDGSIVDLQYGVEGIPTAYLIDKEGVIRGGWIGADPAHEEAIREALADLGIK